MIGFQKVGVVCKDEDLQVFKDLASSNLAWKLEFYQEDLIFDVPVAPRWDFLAVFFPCAADTSGYRYLASIFPGAELVGYQWSDNALAGTFSRGDDGLMVVHLPLALPLFRSLLESLESIKSNEKEIALARSRSEELQEFFEAFVNMIESSWNVNDRKLGMDLLINKILAHLDAEECVVYLLDESASTLQRAYSTGNIKDFDLFDYQANSSIVEKVLVAGNFYVNNNYSLELRVPFSSESVFVRSILCVPLQRRGEKVGVIEVINKKDGAFTEEDIRLIHALINPLTVAIRTISMFEDAERLTITDDLTNLYNYRYLMQCLEAEVRRCLRYKKKVSLLFVDVDGFKQINDNFGHLVGSQALAEMGQVLRRMLRETDIVSRYGGDEFVIVLPETPLNGAMVIAERIRKKVEDYQFVAQNLTVRLTVSLGVANCPTHTLTAEGLIKKADAAMYRAKELSKNTIKVAV